MSDSEQPSSPTLSVILTVFDRADLLRGCMECLARQDGNLDGVEVWVACDGAPNADAMCRATLEPLARTAAAARGDVHFEHRPKLGPAAQRNWAIRQARGEVFLFLNDDVEFGPTLLARHLAAHARRPGHCVVGNTRWHPDVVTTPFMHWVAQNDFFFYLIRDRDDIGWEYVHTLNCSVHRRWFDDDPEGFCEAFPDPAFEDTDWGMRMNERGMKVAIELGAVLLHRHFYEPEGYWRKTAMKGRSARLLIERHPETRDRILGPAPGPFGGMGRRLRATMTAWREGQEGPGAWESRMARLFRPAAANRR